MALVDPQLNFVQCLGAAGLHRMAYWEWPYRGPALAEGCAPPVLVCVHGLSRQGRDFDSLARAMQDRYRVVCPDVVGRGESDWLAHPAGYQLPAYVADMVSLLARLNAPVLDWVGTSMGGLIGMGLAALPKNPIRRLVLNDVGPTIAFEALQRIGGYLGLPKRFASAAEGAAYLASISAGFGPHSEAQWAALSAPMLRAEGGQFRLHYDPAIAQPFASFTKELAEYGSAALWKSYEAIACPTLLLRGEDSDLLSAETAQQMTERGPRARLQGFAGVGHAPTLIQPEQIAAVRRFLNEA
ncbi:pimeloyl-ACP methyl ester carboxylesterase [Paucibacter oligotrophus]|uniref:Pimeloyl-ACP methyl ester carboxylesterase n=1 Tax=Roseateles oligotrophus TaxID=1769250 RepID=A0A840L6T3_9BURK|nr:alpha/beta hydrolase [Roseateles oligotrophus]MBB4841928.1 pimeloyl-ACP methyl ester carboxylesterase [Roseateles oligotrophus]